MAGAAIAAGIVAAILAKNWSYHRQVEQAQGWVADAPACPQISAADYRQKGYGKRERTTELEGATLARQSGHVMCSDVDTPGGWGFLTHPVCQFTSPTAIRVRRAGVDTYFEPGLGRLVTVSLDAAGPTCRLTGKFTLSSDPTN